MGSDLTDAKTLRAGRPPKRLITTDVSEGTPIGRLYQSPTQLSSTPFVLGKSLRRRHIAHLAQSGSGKTVTAEIAAIHASKNDNGMTFVVDPKGGFAEEFLPAYYFTTGSLSDVVVVEAADSLPRLPLFSLNPYLENPEIEISRQRLIEVVVDAAMGVLEAASFDNDGFNNAPQSLDLLRSVISALFLSGINKFSIHDLVSELQYIAEGTYNTAQPDPVFRRYLIRSLMNLLEHAKHLPMVQSVD